MISNGKMKRLLFEYIAYGDAAARTEEAAIVLVPVDAAEYIY